MSDFHINEADVERLITDADIPSEAVARGVGAEGINVCDAIDPVIDVLEAIKSHTSNPWIKLAITIAIKALEAYKRANCRG